MNRSFILCFLGSLLLMSGKSDAQQFKQLNDSLLFHLSVKNYLQADVNLSKMKPLIGKHLDQKNKNFRDFWWNAVICYKNIGKEKELLEALEWVEKWHVQQLQDNQPDFGFLCLEKGLYYSRTGNLGLSGNYLIKARDLLRTREYESGNDYVSATHALAMLLQKQKKWDQSEQLFEEIFSLAKKGGYYGKIPGIIHSYGQFQIAWGHYGKASDVLFMLLMDRAQNAGLNDSLYVEVILDLSKTQHALGLYLSAKSLLGNAAVRIQKKYGSGQEYFRKLILALGELCLAGGQVKEAETFLNQAVLITEKLYGAESPELWIVQLAKIRFFNNSFKPGEALTALQQISYGLNNPRIKNKQIIYSRYLFEKGNTHLLLNQMDSAENCFRSARDLIKQQEGDSSLFYIEVMNQYIRLFYRNGENFKAIVLLSEINQLLSKYLPARHPIIDKQLEKEIMLHEEFGEYDLATMFLIAYSGTKVNQIREIFQYFSEYEKNVFLDHNASLLDHINSSAFLYPTTDEVYLETRYLMNAALKSLTLSDTYRMLKKARNSNRPSVLARVKRMDSLKTTMQYQYSLPQAKRSNELPWIRLQYDFLEKSLRKEMENGTGQDVFEASFEINDYKRNLKEAEIAIEFVRFRLRRNEWTDSVMYAAYVLKKDDKMPVFVPLFEERQLTKIFDSAGNTVTGMVSKLYRGSAIRNKSSAAFLGKDLYQLIWAPLEPYLKGIKTISYAPAGKLHAVSFQALSVDSNAVLADQYHLIQYNSTRSIVLREKQPDTTKPGSIALFGDAAYTTLSDGSVTAKETKNNFNGNTYTEPQRGQQGLVWSALPGTAEEVNHIKQLFEKNGNSTSVFMQQAATEQNLKKLNGNAPKILHIATHGFSFPEPFVQSSNEFIQVNWFAGAEDPLLRNGLVFSGGNDVWSGRTPVEGTEDGIATSYEISQLNLSNTELVVLSACETALGDVKGSEGVFGLQRAFKMAGVKKLIVSLWQVPDKETAELMSAFYDYWLKGKTISEAFSQAQADMRKKYSPYYWAAFVLVE